MRIVKRKEGQWVEIRHKSGDIIRMRVLNIRGGFPGMADLVFDDDHDFAVILPERAVPTIQPSKEQL